MKIYNLYLIFLESWLYEKVLQEYSFGNYKQKAEKPWSVLPGVESSGIITTQPGIDRFYLNPSMNSFSKYPFDKEYKNESFELDYT